MLGPAHVAGEGPAHLEGRAGLEGRHDGRIRGQHHAVDGDPQDEVDVDQQGRRDGRRGGGAQHHRVEPVVHPEREGAGTPEHGIGAVHDLEQELVVAGHRQGVLQQPALVGDLRNVRDAGPGRGGDQCGREGGEDEQGG